jgi:hypothetical protein
MKFLQAVQSKLMLLEQDAPPADAAMPADPNAAPAAAPAPAPAATPGDIDQLKRDFDEQLNSKYIPSIKALAKYISDRFATEVEADSTLKQQLTNVANAKTVADVYQAVQALSPETVV